ncbi:MAG TPA: tetratricopeptide repeat protein [Holophagaceae bacterium]
MAFRPILLAFVCLAFLGAQPPSLDTLRKEGAWKQVQARISGWYASNPQDPYAQLWMSRVKVAFGDLDGGLDLARKAAVAKPGDADIQAQLALCAGQQAGREESWARKLSLARELRKAAEAALAVNPGHPEASEVMLMYDLNAPFFLGGSVDKAQALAEQVGRIDAPRGLLLQAKIALHRKDKAGAASLLNRALALDPADYDALLLLAVLPLLDRPQNLDQALGTYRRAVAVRPTGVLAHNQIAAILAEQGKWAELDRELADAKRRLPDNLAPWYAAASNLIAENKHLDHAEPLLRTYLSQPPEGGSPSGAQAHWRLGQLLERLGRPKEALVEYRATLDLAPGYKPALAALARVKD